MTVLSLRHGLPNKLSLHFDDEPERGSYTLARWEDGKLGALEVPRVGETLELPLLRLREDLQRPGCPALFATSASREVEYSDFLRE